MYILCLLRSAPYLTNRLPLVVLMSRVRSLYDRRRAVTYSLIVLYVCSSTVASVLLIVRQRGCHLEHGN